MQLRKKIHTHGASFVSPRPSPDAPNVSPPPLLFLCPLLLSLLSTRVSRTRCQESRCHLPRSTSIFFSSSFTSALHSYSSNIYQEPSRALSLGSLAGLSRWALSLRSLAGLSRCALSLRSLAALSPALSLLIESERTLRLRPSSAAWSRPLRYPLAHALPPPLPLD